MIKKVAQNSSLIMKATENGCANLMSACINIKIKHNDMKETLLKF